MLPEAPELYGKRLTLRRPVVGDVETRFNLGRHREIVSGYGGSYNPHEHYTRADAEAAIGLIEKNPYAWVMDVGQLIGGIRFHGIDDHDRRAVLAVGIDDPQYLGRGFGTDAIRLVLQYGFRAGLHRVSLRVVAYNTRAIACYRKSGFVEEGREREAALVDGVRHDDIIMGLLAREFEVQIDPSSRPEQRRKTA